MSIATAFPDTYIALLPSVLINQVLDMTENANKSLSRRTIPVMTIVTAFPDTYFALLSNDLVYYVIDMTENVNKSLSGRTMKFDKCVHCKSRSPNMLCFYSRSDCDCCSGDDVYLCKNCLSKKYKYVHKTRKHQRTVVWRNKSRARRYKKRVAKSQRTVKNTANVGFVDFANLFN